MTKAKPIVAGSTYGGGPRLTGSVPFTAELAAKFNPVARALRHPSLKPKAVRPQKGRGAFKRRPRTAKTY